MSKQTIIYRLQELGNGYYDLAMEPVTLKFKTKKQAKKFWDNLTRMKSSGTPLTEASQPIKEQNK